MNEGIVKEISQSFDIPFDKIIVVLNLLNEGNTIPFIARYRKELTGGMDEEQINNIYKEWDYQKNLNKRKEDVIRLIDEKGLLTPELRVEIMKATKLVEVEDLYRPFKEKKKTKASEAIKNGLEPLALWMLSFPDTSVKEEALKYLNENVKTSEEAIMGAKYIIAEKISDDAEHRKYLRKYTENTGNIVSKIKKDAVDERKTYEMYYDYQEPVKKIPPHRILAINRADTEKVVASSIVVVKEDLIKYLCDKTIIKSDSSATPFIEEAIEDAYKRLIFPSIEREVFSDLFERAEVQAISVFGTNLEKLLLQPPIKGKTVLGFDPAFRTGCKLTVVDLTGKVLTKSVIYPHERHIGDTVTEEQLVRAERQLLSLITEYLVDIIAIGNGTASRESESFVSSLLKKHSLNTKYIIVSEAGASVYSASEVAREEFPDYSVEERSAASIARRVQDPLSELVKIDPKSIGVGQYQHDVSEKLLGESLDFVVVKAVNSVGVDVNTASKSLLKYVSGITKTVSESIVAYRNTNGSFKSRNELKKVPKLGQKVFEQAVGFMRITDGKEVYDMTSIHPESYSSARKIQELLGISNEMLGKSEAKERVSLCDKNKLRQTTGIDQFTLNDILDAFVAPLRDPRDEYPQPILKSNIVKIEDLKVGMELEGTVRNVVDFGVFVDIGLKSDGLLHISKMSKRYVSHPKELFEVGQVIKVYVFAVDLIKQKVSLTIFKE